MLSSSLHGLAAFYLIKRSLNMTIGSFERR
jgi:hypothetical protein